MIRHVVLMSGGPDSLITLQFVKNNYLPGLVIPIHVSMNHLYDTAEKKALGKIEALMQIEIQEFKGRFDFSRIEESDANIYGRNAYLCIAAASVVPKGDDAYIWLSVQKDERSIPDRSDAFFDKMSRVLAVLNKPNELVVSTPWTNKDKTDMVRYFLNEGGSTGVLRSSWSCYKDTSVQCGNCPACIRRYIAFSLNGIEEEYLENPKNSATALDYINRARVGEYYSEERNQRILAALT